MATRFCRLLNAILTGKRVDPVSQHIHQAEAALRAAQRAARRLESELSIGEATLLAVASRVR